MKDVKVKIKVKMTLYGRFAFKIYLPFLESLGFYDLKNNMLNDVKNNIGKYFVIKGIDMGKDGGNNVV